MKNALRPESPVELLKQLVKCPSVNPNRRRPHGPPFGEAQLVDMLGELLSSWGARIQVEEIAPGRVNLVACWRGRNSEKSLMLEAHSDTVQVEGMTIPPFTPTVEGGKLYGRGACDTKGSMAAMLYAVWKVLEEDGAPPIDLFFVSCCDEELGANGAHALVKSGFKVDAAVVGEPTDLSIIHAHKGAVRWRIHTLGVSAHSAFPEQGVNAISQMSNVVQVLEGPLADSLKSKHHPLLGHPTISVGTIQGGTQVNVIPALCTIEVDRRVLPGEDVREITHEVEHSLKTLKKRVQKLNYQVEETEWYPPFEEDTEGLLAQRVARACQKILGKASFSIAPWSANSGVFKDAGIPCLLFGPGSIEQAHTPSEFVDIEQVCKAAQVYLEVIRSFGG